jgi:hypothetical protein
MYALFFLQFLLSEWVGLNIKELTKGFDRFIRINFELLHQQAPMYFVSLGKLIDEEEPQKIEKYQNLPEEEQESLNIELIINLVEKLKEYLIQKTPPSNLLNKKIHLNLQIQLNSKPETIKTCDRRCKGKCGHNSYSVTKDSKIECYCEKPC